MRVASISCNRPVEKSSGAEKVFASKQEEAKTQNVEANVPVEDSSGEMQIVKDLVANFEKESQICSDQENRVLEPYSEATFVGRSSDDFEFFSFFEFDFFCSSDELESLLVERKQLAEDVASSKYSDQVREAFDEAFI